MKRSSLVTILAVVGAGAIAINLLPAAHSNVASQASPAGSVIRAFDAPPAVAQASPVVTASTATPSPSGQPIIQKASLDMRQAPVPLLIKPRPPVSLPAAEAATTDAKTADAKPGEAPTDPAADASSQTAAKAAIEADGYKAVKALRKGAGGAWHAMALRGSTTVSLTVDAGGSVSAD
jgi:hypothetical protein